MVDGGPPTLPPSGTDPAQGVLKALELGSAEVQRVSAELKILAQTTRLEAQVIRVNDNGTVTLQTARGEVDVRPPVPLQNGQTVQLRLEAGSPPAQAKLALPPQTSVTRGDTPTQQQPLPVATPTTSTSVDRSSATNTQPVQPPPQTTVSPQAAQRFDLPPVPLGASIPTQFVPLPIPPSQTGVEVLLTALFNAGSFNDSIGQPALQSQQNPLSSLAQIAQATLPPPIVEGLKNVQLLKAALTGRQFNPAPLLNNILGVQSVNQTFPTTGLNLPRPPLSISPLAFIPSTTGKMPVINVEKPVTGVGTVLSSVMNGGGKSTPQIQPHLNTARVFFTQSPGKLLQVPNFPIATAQGSGQSSSLFFGVTLGQTATGDFAVLGTNGIATFAKQSVTGPLLPGTVLVAQGQGAVSQPNINLFNVPVINVDGSFLNFNPSFGDGWPVLDEVLSVLQQVDPAFASSVRSSIPNVSNPTQLPTSILFFIAATGIGDVRAWLGDQAFERLIQAGRTELSTLLGSDFNAIASRASEQTPDGWRPFMVPIFFGESLHRMQFFTRHHYEEDENGQQGGKKTRFLVNVEQTKLGPIQLDGLVNEHRLDMVLRSDDMLTQDIRQGIRQHYNNALKEGGLSGAINFEHGDTTWVEVDTTPNIDQSVFI